MDHQLDELVLSDEYIPPVPFFDLDYAKQAVEARYIIEQEPKRKTQQKQLDYLLQWRAAVIELSVQQKGDAFTGIAPPATAPGAPICVSEPPKHWQRWKAQRRPISTYTQTRGGRPQKSLASALWRATLR